MAIRQVYNLDSQVWDSDGKTFFDDNSKLIDITNANIFTEDFNPLRVQQVFAGYYKIRGVIRFSNSIAGTTQFVTVGTVPFNDNDSIIRNIMSNVGRDTADGSGASDIDIGLEISASNVLRIMPLQSTLTTTITIQANLEAYDGSQFG